jgi:hypothetical protein
MKRFATLTVTGRDNINDGSDEQGRNDCYGENFAHDGPPSSRSNHKADRANPM